jgi:hypothetical protein
MTFSCYFCNNDFTLKHHLHRHLADNRCKSTLTTNIIKIHDIIQEQRIEIEKLKQQHVTNIGDHSVTAIGNNNINMKIEININPITKLDISHIEHDKLKNIIETYDDNKEISNGKEKFNNDKINLLLSGYIKDIICDTEHPENHAVKYIKKRPPTYNTQVEDSEGNTVSVIKGLKDTCELLTDPILDKLKVKLKEFIKKYKGDTEPEFDFVLYENAIKELKKELNKKNVKKALNSVLKNDILNNIEMKLSLIQPPTIKEKV